LKNLKNNINKFDRISRFRLINAIAYSLALGLVAPILVTLKGIYFTTFVISLFMVANQLTVKFNRYLTDNLTLSQFHKIGTIIHFLYLISFSIYFFSPVIMIYFDSSVVIIETMLFSAFSIVLDEHIAKNYPSDFKEFKIVRNNYWTDSHLLGLGLISLITSYFSMNVAIALNLCYNILFSLWLFYNWHFFDKEDK